MTQPYDFLILGGGSAGYAAARTAAAGGLRTVVVDGADELGGLCILRGCMPSKALIESGNRALVLRHAAEFGLWAEVGAANVALIQERKRRMIADFAEYRQGQLADGRFDLIRGWGCFENANTVQVSLREGGTRRVEFKQACIATGSRVAVPSVPGLAEVGYWTSDEVLDASELPSSFIVLGGGAIALEMAHFLEALGRRVTVIQRGPRLLSMLPVAAGEAVKRTFEARGMVVHCDTRLVEVSRVDGQKRVAFSQGGHTWEVLADEILVATGRSPETEGLQLEAAGVERAGSRVKTNNFMQTSCPHIFAAGDVADSLDVVHVAIEEAETAARNALALASGAAASHTVDRRLGLFGVFCDPQVAAVGASEAELEAQGVPFATASYPFNDHGKSIIMGVQEGFVQMTAHRATGEILGACVVGPEATELIHEVVVAMHYRATVQQFMTVPHYHPTLSEIWTYPAEELAEVVG